MAGAPAQALRARSALHAARHPPMGTRFQALSQESWHRRHEGWYGATQEPCVGVGGGGLPLPGGSPQRMSPAEGAPPSLATGVPAGQRELCGRPGPAGRFSPPCACLCPLLPGPRRAGHPPLPSRPRSAQQGGTPVGRPPRRPHTAHARRPVVTQPVSGWAGTSASPWRPPVPRPPPPTTHASHPGPRSRRYRHQGEEGHRPPGHSPGPSSHAVRLL